MPILMMIVVVANNKSIAPLVKRKATLPLLLAAAASQERSGQNPVKMDPTTHDSKDLNSDSQLGQHWVLAAETAQNWTCKSSQLIVEGLVKSMPAN